MGGKVLSPYGVDQKYQETIWMNGVRWSNENREGKGTSEGNAAVRKQKNHVEKHSKVVEETDEDFSYLECLCLRQFSH